jgi:hypothetical protein
MAVRVVSPPGRGFWRVARGPDPLALPPPLEPSDADSPLAGNRFDSPTGQYRVLYFGTKLEACFAETLSRLRPQPGLREVIGADWTELGFMPVGAVPADWRHRRLAVRARPIGDLPFLDAEAAETLAILRDALAPSLALYGYDDLDVALVRGRDKRVPRAISYWAFRQESHEGEPQFAGVRYTSRLGDEFECWALFDDVALEELEKRPITTRLPSLTKVARRYGLTVH